MVHSQPIALPHPPPHTTQQTTDWTMGSYTGSSTGGSFNPASYTRHFLGSPMSLTWRAGSFGGRFAALPEGSPTAMILNEFENEIRAGKLSSSVESDRSSLLNAMNVFDRQGELCRNYTCCGQHLTDLHALLEHFEEVHIVVVDPLQPQIYIPFNPISHPASGPSTTASTSTGKTTPTPSSASTRQEYFPVPQNQNSRAATSSQQQQQNQNQNNQEYSTAFDTDDMDMELELEYPNSNSDPASSVSNPPPPSSPAHASSSSSPTSSSGSTPPPDTPDANSPPYALPLPQGTAAFETTAVLPRGNTKPHLPQMQIPTLRSGITMLNSPFTPGGATVPHFLNMGMGTGVGVMPFNKYAGYASGWSRSMPGAMAEPDGQGVGGDGIGVGVMDVGAGVGGNGEGQAVRPELVFGTGREGGKDSKEGKEKPKEAKKEKEGGKGGKEKERRSANVANPPQPVASTSSSQQLQIPTPTSQQPQNGSVATGGTVGAIQAAYPGTSPTTASALLLTPQKPFRCPKPNCNKSYKQANGLKYHMTHGSCNFAPPKDVEAVRALLAGKRARQAASSSSSSPTSTNPVNNLIPSPLSNSNPHSEPPTPSGSQTPVGEWSGDGAGEDEEFGEGGMMHLSAADLAEVERRVRPFACGVGDCTRRYKNMNGLRYHYQHSGEHGAVGLGMLAGGIHECLVRKNSHTSISGNPRSREASSSRGGTRSGTPVTSVAPSPTSGTGASVGLPPTSGWGSSLMPHLLAQQAQQQQSGVTVTQVQPFSPPVIQTGNVYFGGANGNATAAVPAAAVPNGATAAFAFQAHGQQQQPQYLGVYQQGWYAGQQVPQVVQPGQDVQMG